MEAVKKWFIGLKASSILYYYVHFRGEMVTSYLGRSRTVFSETRGVHGKADHDACGEEVIHKGFEG